MESVEQSSLWRRTTLRQHHQIGRGYFAVQMGQDSLDYRRVLNAGNDLDMPGTPLAGLNGAATGSILKTRLSRCIHVIATWRSVGVLSSQLSPVG